MKKGEVVAVREVRDMVRVEQVEIMKISMPVEDARDIMGILFWVGGPTDQARGACDRLYKSLSDTGIKRTRVSPRGSTGDAILARTFYNEDSPDYHG